MALRFRSPDSRFFSFALAASAALAMFSALTVPAEARGWRHRYVHYAAAPAPADPAFAAIVVDANSGRTLYAANEDAPRHPASLTKVMTLYLLFEQLDKGALTLQSQIPDLRTRRRPGTAKARARARRHDLGRRRDQGDRHPFGQ